MPIAVLVWVHYTREHYNTTVALSFSSSLKKIRHRCPQNLNACGFEECRYSDVHTKGFNEFISVFSTLIVRLTADREYHVHLMLLSIRKIRENGRWEIHAITYTRVP